MIRLLIGVIVIGFLLYFIRSVLSEYFRPKNLPPRPLNSLPSKPAEEDGDQVKALQDRIAVLERLIVDAENAKPVDDASKDDGAGEPKGPPQG